MQAESADMQTRVHFAIASMIFFLSNPAAAAGAAQVPEADSVMLFALGVLGVIVGRRAAMKKRDD